MDLDISGTDRSAYLSTWFQQTPARRTLVLQTDGRIAAVGTIRRCREAHKIGPLFAPDATTAVCLLRALAAEMDATEIIIDVPDSNSDGVRLVCSLGLVPIFSCARMYRGAPLVRQLGRIFAETTFELG
jgi:hypothetical protein